MITEILHKYKKPKKTPEGNVSDHHPLTNFAYLLGTVLLATVLLFFVLGWVAQWVATQISPETENQIGEMLLPMVLYEEEEIEDDKRIQYLNGLLDSLPKSDENLRLPLKLHLVDSEVINAAITVGGHVFIHTALLKEIKSENELAFILAHELGHFQAYDPLKSLGRSLVFIVGLMAVGFGTSETGGTPDIISWTGNLTQLSYSRNQEQSADLYALYRIIERYGHGGHSLDFFKRLNNKEKEENRLQLRLSEYFSTHPLSQDRINYLKKIAEEKGWYMEGELTPLPKWIGCPNMMPCTLEK
jgi:beta-barrel assembly-enhancing protease